MGELTWVASEAIPWLALSSTAGDTPAEPELQVNPAGLPLRSYSGTITLDAIVARTGPQAVKVCLNVIPANTNKVYLPLVVK